MVGERTLFRLAAAQLGRATNYDTGTVSGESFSEVDPSVLKNEPPAACAAGGSDPLLLNATRAECQSRPGGLTYVSLRIVSWPLAKVERRAIASCVVNGRKLETAGPFAGLWVRVSGALRKAGYANLQEVRADIKSGCLHAFRPVRDYGRFADRDVRKLLGLSSWEEQWRDVPYGVLSNFPESVRGKGLFG